jgi:hypothetical protein
MSVHIGALMTMATLWSGASAGNLNLFDGFNSTKKKGPCQDEILEKFEGLNGTGAQVNKGEFSIGLVCPDSVCGVFQ